MGNNMMTRREMLALLGSSAVARSLLAQDAPFTRIDVHGHVFRTIPALIDGMEKENWRALNICVWQQFDNQVQPRTEFKTVDEMIAAAAKVHRESRGRIAWASTFDARGFESRDFTEKTIATVQQSFKNDAIAVKIWKTIGMKIRGKAGNYLMPDDKTLMPVYEAIQKQDRTLLAHIAEPDGAWAPPDAPGANYWKQNPQWRGEPGGPSKEAILQSRDRILARYPKLRVVGCHIGSNEEDLKALAKRLDTYPNFVVDLSARVRYLFRGDPAARQFVEKYQDRILYGSDHSVRDSKDETVAAYFTTIDQQWNMFASNKKISEKTREIQGMGLPEGTLRKVFHDNAVRLIPGVAPA